MVLAWGALRSWVWLTVDAPIDANVVTLAALALTLACALAFVRRFEHVASRVGLVALLAELVVTFPLTPNHFFIELYAVAILSLAGADTKADPMVLAGLRWLTALVLFHTGLQKLLYGHYVSGDFLAFMIGRGDRFADLFRWTLPAGEIARLTSYDLFRHDAGPYRAAVPLLVALSNLVWMAELALPVALMVPRTRRVAAIAALAFVLLMQLGAREMGFALLFGNLLLLFAPVRLASIVSSVCLTILGVALAAAWGVAPGQNLLQEWHLW